MKKVILILITTFFYCISFSQCLGDIPEELCTQPQQDCCTLSGTCQGTTESCANSSYGNACISLTCGQAGVYNCHMFVKYNLYSESFFSNGDFCVGNTNTCNCSDTDTNIKLYSPFQTGQEQEILQVSSVVGFNDDADAVDYNGGGHSALKIGNDLYRSKYGFNGPVLEHPLLTDFGTAGGDNNVYVDQMVFFQYVGFIKGKNHNEFITNYSSFDLEVFDKPGVEYLWSISNDKININGSNTGNKVSLTPQSNGNGSVTINLVLKTYDNNVLLDVKEQCITVSLDIPGNNVCDLTGRFKESGNIYDKSLVTHNFVSGYATDVDITKNLAGEITCSEATNYVWTKTSGSGNLFSQNNGTLLYVYLNSGESINLKVEAYSSSNTLLSQRTVSFSRSSGWKTSDNEIEIYPNPTNGQINITNLGNKKIKSVKLLNKNGEILRRYKRIPSSYIFDVSGIPAGTYFIRIKIKDKETIVRKIIVY